MMTEISLNILDIAQNSIRAQAKLIEIYIKVDTNADLITVHIKDDGYGMTPEQIDQVSDPFFTTRTTRSIGLGVPFFKMAAECTGGTFAIDSVENQGTSIEASFVLSHIDRMPLGDINGTIYNLIAYNPEYEFFYSYTCNDRSFELDTRELREILGDIPFTVPEVSEYIRDYLQANSEEVNNGVNV